MREKPVTRKTSMIKYSEETLNLAELEKNLSADRVELGEYICAL